MKQLMLCLVLLFALSVVWQSATAALSGALDVPLTLRSALIGFVGGLLFSLILAYTWIYNRVVEADRRRAHDKVDQDHNTRRI